MVQVYFLNNSRRPSVTVIVTKVSPILLERGI